MKKITIITALLVFAVSAAVASNRERLLMDFGWKFAFGHPFDKSKDYNVGTSYFTYLAKAGYGEGAAAVDFDDRAWRKVDLPHDWAVEAPFSAKASHSHGYKAVGPNFPETSVGWYRKSFEVPASDKGKRIAIEFDGVSRDAKVWVNGFYCGNEPSGYNSFAFDVSEYINYGGTNVVAVRADVSTEEGWYYEGAGIYRHVWLTKTNLLHVPQNGTYVTTEIDNEKALVTCRVKTLNKRLVKATFEIRNSIIDANGNKVAANVSNELVLGSFGQSEAKTVLTVPTPRLWSLEDPYLYTLVSEVVSDGSVVDVYNTTFGIRTIQFIPDKGFFLNGKHVKLKGTNNHQDHAGVGVALPDGMQEFRIKQLKAMGSNAYRSSHNPPTPELLEACDRLGMLVINENRLMGVTQNDFGQLERLILRDRNHPCVIVWSIGNEEWAIEGNEKGAAIAQTMQAFVKTIDPTRPVNAAVSGGWGNGIGTVIEVMGYNYLRHGDTDAHFAKFPWQSSMGTEEGSTNTTRGIYVDDMEKQYLVAYDRPTPSGFLSIQQGWKHYAERDYLAGMFIWTGFDYRGESTPFAFPSVSSYFGMLDMCGFPKDNVYYLKSWWGSEPVLHILPHWNWKSRLGEDIDVWVYSNCEEVELFVNNKSQGKKVMPLNGHLSWMVKYAPGKVEAVGYKNGKKTMNKVVSTTGSPSGVGLSAHRSSIMANAEDVSVVTVQINDKKGLMVPDANVDVQFTIEGPGRIIGVGNGDPTSHEADRFLETVKEIGSVAWKYELVDNTDITAAVLPSFNDANWASFGDKDALKPGAASKPSIFRGSFGLDDTDLKGTVTWMFRSIGINQSVYLNGSLLQLLPNNKKHHTLPLDVSLLKNGNNSVVVVAEPFVMAHEWDKVNTHPGNVQVILPEPQWHRKTFNGLAQVIVQSTGDKGQIVLKAKADGLTDARLTIDASSGEKRAFVPSVE